MNVKPLMFCYMGFDLTKIKNFDDVLDNLPCLTDKDLKKLIEMGVYKPVSVEDPDINEIITDEDIESDFEDEPMPPGWE